MTTKENRDMRIENRGISVGKQLSFDLSWIPYRSAQFRPGQTPFLISVPLRNKASHVTLCFQGLESSRDVTAGFLGGWITDTSCGKALVLAKRGESRKMRGQKRVLSDSAVL